jgi:hypothetical protein
MSEYQISHLIGDLLFVLTLGVILFLGVRSLLKNKNTGMNWVSPTPESMRSHPAFNVDGTPMVSEYVDMKGNAFGVTNHLS